MQQYLDAIRDRVCSVCIDGIFASDGKFLRCGMPADRTCPVEFYLPQVVEVVESIDSPWMDDYVARLRDRVCTKCNQTDEGICTLRIKAECPLDTYFMLVAEAVEGVRDLRKAGSGNH